ncbi:MAG: neutral/alkaline non-lysosomal ceramidase N-terminal domain-containing protein [Bryobacterales bacterium]|nr:neutral/alkaline non-lysosomal ceramidase N-terminal domain-containing protein [Bryobacterales bacterium]
MRSFCLAAIVLACALPGSGEWRAGAASVNINPTEPVWLAGYGGRTGPSRGILQDIFVKALALENGGERSVLVTSDLVGLDTKMVEEIASRTQQKFGVPRERLILNYSHNHSCPVTGDVLRLYYELTPEQGAAVGRYTRRLLDQYIEAIGTAIAKLEPAELSFEQGLAGFAVNRRRARPGGRKLAGPVDHDVPVLAVRTGGALRAVAFGYSCHTTALSGYEVNGDYAGYAQEALEKAYPGAVALFVMGCGGDANPLPRVMGVTTPEAVELASMYGRIVAKAVEIVLRGPMQPVRGRLKAGYTIAEIPFQKGPTREELAARLPKEKGLPRRATEHLLRVYDREGKLPDRYPYPVQVWRFGADLTLVALTGESVVDYCLRFKDAFGWDNTWVAGYNNELLSYVPSLRVLREGGYEGTTGMAEYGHPAPYGYAVEEAIAQRVEELYEETKP